MNDIWHYSQEFDSVSQQGWLESLFSERKVFSCCTFARMKSVYCIDELYEVYRDVHFIQV